jgi:hypothetical protein
LNAADVVCRARRRDEFEPHKAVFAQHKAEPNLLQETIMPAIRKFLSTVVASDAEIWPTMGDRHILTVL